METLRHNQERLVQTMREVKEIWDQGEKNRKANELEVARMHAELDGLAMTMSGKEVETTSAEAIEAKYTANN